MWLCLFSGGYILKHTVAKSQRNATDLLHPTYLHIWKRTVEKCHINAVSVNMYPLSSAICGSFVKTVTLKQGQIVFWKKHILYQHKGNKTLKNTCKKMYIKTADTNATTVVFQQPRNETCRFTRRYNSEKLFKYKQCSYEGNQKISVYNDLWILCDCCDYKTSQKIFNAAYN